MRKIIKILLVVLFLFNCAGKVGSKKNERNRGKIHYKAQSKIDENKNFGIQVSLNLPNSLFVFQKINNQFECQYQLSIAIIDTLGNRIFHHTWQEKKSVDYFEETRSEAKSIPTGHFFKVDPGKYSISILIEDLDSKYRWHKKIPIQNYNSDFISPILLIPENLASTNKNFAGNVIPEKSDKIQLQIPYNFSEIETNSYLAITGINDEETVIEDSVFVEKNANNIIYEIQLSEFWMGKLKLYFNYGKISEELSLILPGKNTLYWKNINTTVQIMSYILTAKEIRELKDLSKNEKIVFIKNYWKTMDPTPETEKNEVMNEFFDRVQYSSNNFAEFGPGWQSDRGRIYILYGPPEHVEISNQNNQGYKYEIWHYPSGKQFIFLDEGMFGNYRLYREVN